MANTQDNPALTPDAVDLHRRILFWLLIDTIILFAVFVSILVYTFCQRKGLTAFPATLAMGALAGFISALRRVYQFDEALPIDKIAGLLKDDRWYVPMYCFTPALVGAVGAGVLYLVFAGQLLSGSLFPEFRWGPCHAKGCSSFYEFVENWQAAEGFDYAKLLVWGFIAGFSERFVPDILTRLTGEAEKPNESSKQNDGKGS